MVAHILASVAQFERERIGERRAEAAMALQKVARWQGGRFLFGYRPERNRSGWLLVPDPDTAPAVAWMAERIVRGQSATSLARDLEDRGIKTPREREALERRGRHRGAAESCADRASALAW